MASNLTPDDQRDSHREDLSSAQALDESNISERCTNGNSQQVELERAEQSKVLEHLPDDLKERLTQYMMNPNKQNLNLKDEISFLKPLAQFYENQYESRPESWTAGLRAHGLWMACSIRDPENSDYIQSAIKLMQSELSQYQLLYLNKSNKEALMKYRNSHKEHTNKVKSLLSNINSDDWSNNIKFMKDFTSAVRRLSTHITQDVKQFFCRLLDQCVWSLGRDPPCGIAVIAIGSLARGEMTTYSDIEYMFLIQKGNDSILEYFRQFAIQSYFFLSLLGESSVYTYSIKELDAINFEGRVENGLRIDGLSDRAGNMPTGNELEGSELIFTVEQLVNQYQRVVDGYDDGPNKGVGSDLVDMITHRTLVWCSGNGKELYNNLQKRLLAIHHSKDRRMSSQKLLLEDLKKYRFLPEYARAHSGHQDVKRHIYRYPSLLLTGFNNAIDLKSETNWETVDTLVSLRKCGQKTREFLSFLLSSALFIRVDSYGFYKGQKDKVTLFPCEPNSPQYSCPRDLFVLMMSYLFPLKQVADKEIKNLSVDVMRVPSFNQDTFTAVCLTHIYCQNYDHLVREFISRCGQSDLFQNPDKLLSNLTSDQSFVFMMSLQFSNKLTEQHIPLVEAAARKSDVCHKHKEKLIAVCYITTNTQEALIHAQRYMEDVERTHSLNYEKFISQVLVAHCYIRNNQLDKSKFMLEFMKITLNEMKTDPSCTAEQWDEYWLLYIDELVTLRRKQGRYKEGMSLCLEELDLYKKLYGAGVQIRGIGITQKDLGLFYFMLQRYEESGRSLRRSLRTLLSISSEDDISTADSLLLMGTYKIKMGKLQQAMSLLTRSCDMHCRLFLEFTPTHSHIIPYFCQIGLCHFEMGEFDEAASFYNKEYAIHVLATSKDISSLAICTNTLGEINWKRKDYTTAIWRFNESRNFNKLLVGEGNQQVISDEAFKMGQCNYQMGQCHYQMGHYEEALQMMEPTYTKLTNILNCVEDKKITDLYEEMDDLRRKCQTSLRSSTSKLTG